MRFFKASANPIVTIHQFNGGYHPAEDRLLFRFNTSSGEEYRLWLTRRVTYLFLERSRQHAIHSLSEQLPEPAAKTVDAFRQEALQSQSDFATPFQAPAKLPLGPEPFLAVDVTITPLPDTTPPMNEVTFALAIGKNLNLKLPDAGVQTVRVLLGKLQEQAQWGVAPEVNEAAPVVAPPSGSMH